MSGSDYYSSHLQRTRGHNVGHNIGGALRWLSVVFYSDLPRLKLISWIQVRTELNRTELRTSNQKLCRDYVGGGRSGKWQLSQKRGSYNVHDSWNLVPYCLWFRLSQTCWTAGCSCSCCDGPFLCNCLISVITFGSFSGAYSCLNVTNCRTILCLVQHWKLMNFSRLILSSLNL